MKKFIAMFLAMVMIMAMSVTAFAAENETLTESPATGKDAGSYDIGVTGKYEAGYIDADPVISVDIEWESMEFTYAAGGYQGVWNPGTHEYDNPVDSEEGGWRDNEGRNIKLTNHSNVGVEATFEFTKNSSISEEIGGTFTGPIKKKLTLNAGVENKYDEADSKTVSFKISGTPASTLDGKLGTISITIAQPVTDSEE